MKTEECKLYSRVFWIFLPNFIKIAPCNFELYHFKVKTFFFETHCSPKRHLHLDIMIWHTLFMPLFSSQPDRLTLLAVHSKTGGDFFGGVQLYQNTGILVASERMDGLAVTSSQSQFMAYICCRLTAQNIALKLHHFDLLCISCSLQLNKSK